MSKKDVDSNAAQPVENAQSLKSLLPAREAVSQIKEIVQNIFSTSMDEEGLNQLLKLYMPKILDSLGDITVSADVSADDLAQVLEQFKPMLESAVHRVLNVVFLDRSHERRDFALYRAVLMVPQEEIILLGIHIHYQDAPEGEQDVIRSRIVWPGDTFSEDFEVKRGFRAKIRILSTEETIQAFGIQGSIVNYIVA